MNKEDIIRDLAYSIWEKRGGRAGEDRAHWFEAESIFNKYQFCLRRESLNFYHSFRRIDCSFQETSTPSEFGEEDVEESIRILDSMLDVGLLLIPEVTSFGEKSVTQCRLSLTYINDVFLQKHAQMFGPVSLKMKSYEELMRLLPLMPVIYVPSYHSDTNELVHQFGSGLMADIANLQRYIENSGLPAQEREALHRPTRYILRAAYPTLYKSDTNLEDIYIKQNEWKVINDDKVTVIKGLTDSDKRKLLQLNGQFFTKIFPGRDEATNQPCDVQMVDMVRKVDCELDAIVEEILVPQRYVDRVAAMTRIKVSSLEKYKYEFFE